MSSTNLMPGPDLEVETILEKFSKGQHSEIFNSPFLNKLLNECLAVGKDEDLRNYLNSFLESHSKLCDNTEKQLEMVFEGLAPLIIFIQQNWTGPEILMNEAIKQFEKIRNSLNIVNQLIVDGESLVSIIELPELLFLSETILGAASFSFTDLLVAKIWFLRCLFIHQQILEELSPKLFDKIDCLIDEIKNTLTDDSAIEFHLEFARIYLYYNNIQKSKEELAKALKISQINVSLSGALGKRTKFQREDLAQLILKVSIDQKKKYTEEKSCCTLPKDIKLDDDVRLDKVKFADDVYTAHPSLTPLQQAVILGNLFQTEKSQPKDSLADEELQPLINFILEQPKTWSVRMTTLLLRSKLEANHKRTVERAMMQVQVLTDEIKSNDVSFKDRLSFFFVSYLPAKWEIQFTFANILASMGSIKSALEIYRKLEQWENVIYCYNTLQMRHKAQEVIEQELKKNPSPKLWCLLGDATDDVTYYEKAWITSNYRSARAQRHWALFFYYRKNYAESIKHFQKSLEINSLQKEVWYRLGFAALMEEKWEISAQAYRRYCVIDPECFEAWNNLGRCYCELKQKSRAWRAFQEALKIDYSNWKVWDNYMVVSSDLKIFDEVIKSYHEILNLKEKHVDIPILSCLVRGFKSCKNDESEDSNHVESRSQFKTKLLQLFGRLTSQVVNDAELWFLYSEVVEEDSEENRTKKYQLLMKSHRSSINKAYWENTLETCNRMIYVLSKLVAVGLTIRKPDVLMSCQLAAEGAITQIRKKYPDVEICEKLEEDLKLVNQALNN